MLRPGRGAGVAESRTTFELVADSFQSCSSKGCHYKKIVASSRQVPGTAKQSTFSIYDTMLSNNRILQHFNRHLALAFSVIAVSTFNYGFDNAAYNNTQAMDAFQRQFGDWNDAAGTYKISPSWLSLFNSLNYIGFGAGVIIGSLVSERWGRRWCMFAMSAWALVPAIMAVTSVSKHQMMATRILNCESLPSNVSRPESR